MNSRSHSDRNLQFPKCKIWTRLYFQTRCQNKKSLISKKLDYGLSEINKIYLPGPERFQKLYKTEKVNKAQ